MQSDALIQEARMHHAACVEHRTKATEHQHARDRLVHQLRNSDPVQWSYSKIAEAVGCERDLIVFILRKPSPE